MMEAASASETLVNFYQTTWRNNPEDSHLHDKSLIVMLIIYHSMKIFNKIYFCGFIQSLYANVGFIDVPQTSHITGPPLYIQVKGYTDEGSH
jgi:hypothetical protein